MRTDEERQREQDLVENVVAFIQARPEGDPVRDLLVSFVEARTVDAIDYDSACWSSIMELSRMGTVVPSCPSLLQLANEMARLDTVIGDAYMAGDLGEKLMFELQRARWFSRNVLAQLIHVGTEELRSLGIVGPMAISRKTKG